MQFNKFFLIVLCGLSSIFVIKLVKCFNFFNSESYEETTVEKFAFDSGSLEVFNKVGPINITAFDKDEMEIIIIKKAPKRDLLNTIKADISVQDNKASIEVNFGNVKKSKLEAIVNIKIPKNVTLAKLRTDVGSINISNFSNLVNVKTSVGAITLDNVLGSVNAHADTGSINLNLPKSANAIIKASADVGNIKSDFREIKVVKSFPYISGRAEGRLGDGKNNIELSTNVGAITIRSIS